MMNKKEKYQNVLSSFTALLPCQIPKHIQMLNLCALLKKEFHFFWVGFYLTKNETELIIGPYQGEVPCFNITFGKGVCGAAALQQKTQIVANVHQYPGYIACHSEPNSEIVVAGIKNNKTEFVLDIDHRDFDFFDETDQEMLEKLCSLVLDKIW